MKVLHVLYTSIPDHSGSSIRSRGIVSSQLKLGLEPFVITSPFQEPIKTSSAMETIGGIKYIRTYNGDTSQRVGESGNKLGNQLNKLSQIFSFRSKVYKHAKHLEVDIIHAHSTFFCGLAAIHAAKKLSIPCVYEVRSLWEERAAERDGGVFSNFFSGIIRSLETYVMKRADHVIVINESLKDNLVQRNVNSQKISVVVNAVEDTTLKKGAGFTWPVNKRDHFVFAYIGSVSPIEGLDLLFDAWKEFFQADTHYKLKIFGDGIFLKQLAEKIISEDLKNIELCGSFSPIDVEKIYSFVDVVINPRIKSKLTDTVTPLKPLEAMAYNKLVLTSDVGGMNALIKNHVTGLQFKAGDVNDLVKLLKYCINTDEEKLLNIVKSGRNFVLSERSWTKIVNQYKHLYLNLV